MSAEIRWIELPFMRIIDYEKGKNPFSEEDYPDEPCGWISLPFVFIDGMTRDDQMLAAMKVRDILIDDWLRLGKFNRIKNKMCSEREVFSNAGKLREQEELMAAINEGLEQYRKDEKKRMAACLPMGIIKEKQVNTKRAEKVEKANKALSDVIEFLEADGGQDIIQAFMQGHKENFSIDNMMADEMRLVLRLRVLQVWMEK